MQQPTDSESNQTVILHMNSSHGLHNTKTLSKHVQNLLFLEWKTRVHSAVDAASIGSSSSSDINVDNVDYDKVREVFHSIPVYECDVDQQSNSYNGGPWTVRNFKNLLQQLPLTTDDVRKENFKRYFKSGVCTDQEIDNGRQQYLEQLNRYAAVLCSSSSST